MARGNAVATNARTQHLIHRRIGHPEAALLAVGFVNNNVQIAAVTGWIEVINDKRPLRYVGLINKLSVLINFDQRVSIGRAANRGRIAVKRVRQHTIVRCQLKAAETNRIKHFAGGVAVPQRELPANTLQGAQCIGRRFLPVRALVILPAEARVVVELPIADIKAGI